MESGPQPCFRLGLVWSVPSFFWSCHPAPIVGLAWRGLISFPFLAAFKGWSNGHGYALLVTGLVHSCFSLVVRRLPCPSPVMLVADWLSISQASLSFELVFNYTCDPALRLFLGLFVVDPYSAWFHFSLFVVSLVTITVTPSILSPCIDDSPVYSLHALTIHSVLSVYMADLEHFFCEHCSFRSFFHLALMIPNIFSAYFVVSQHSCTLHWRFRVFFLCTLTIPSILSPCVDSSEHFPTLHW